MVIGYVAQAWACVGIMYPSQDTAPWHPMATQGHYRTRAAPSELQEPQLPLQQGQASGAEVGWEYGPALAAASVCPQDSLMKRKCLQEKEVIRDRDPGKERGRQS